MKSANNLKKYLFCFCSIFFPYCLTAQHSVVDSLKEELEIAKPDTTKAIILNNLSEATVRTNPKEAQDYAKSALVLSKKLNFHKGIGKAYFQLGYNQLYIGTPDSASYYYNKSLDVFKKVNYKPGTASALNGLGYASSIIGDEVSSSEYYLAAIKVSSAANDKKNLSKAYLHLGMNFLQKDMVDKAKAYVTKSKKIDEQLNDEYGLAYDNLCLGEIYIKKEMYDTALLHLKQALEYFKKADLVSYAASTMDYIANIYEARDEAEKYRDILEEILKLYEQSGQYGGLSVAHRKMAIYWIYYRKNEKEGRKHLNLSLEYGNKSGHIDFVTCAHRLLSASFNREKKFEEAFKHLRIYMRMEDSLREKKSAEKIADIEAKYENEKKEQEIALLEEKTKVQDLQLSKTNYFIIGLTILSGLVAAVLLLILRQNKLKNRQNSLELQQKALRAQMNPHFIFNALSSIQNYIVLNKGEQAINYLTRFSKLMRAILENSRKEFISLESDIEMLENYLAIEQLKFPGLFEYKITVDDEIDLYETRIPTMLIQPLVENSVKHAFRGMNKNGLIEINFGIHNGKLICKITDNGIGMDKAAELKTQTDGNRKSYGTEIINERVHSYNKKNKQHIDIRFSDRHKIKQELSGTEVELSIPKDAMAEH